MAIEISTTAQLLSEQVNIGQQIILEIDGIDLVFGAVPVTRFWEVGDTGIKIGDAGLLVGGIIEDEKGRAYISLKGTTNNITQQLEVDKGGVGSIQRFSVSLVDKDQELTELFVPGAAVPDVLSREANIYLAFEGGSHPEDSIRIFNGIVTGQEASPGLWKLSIDHPEFLKRQDIWDQINTNLDGSISDTDTTITVDLTTGFIAPADIQKSYLLIDEELIEYTGIGATTFTGATRGALGTIAASHDDDAQVTSFYSLSGPALDMALKVMLSNGGTAFSTGNETPRFVQVTNAITLQNSILLRERIKEELGLEVGDLVTITGATNGANNVTDAPIGLIQNVPQGTIITVTGVTMVPEIESAAVTAFTSQFNTLNEGCGMKPSQVDVAQHLNVRDYFATGFPDYLVYLKDTVNAKEFLTNEVYHPQGFYQVPRKGRASVNITRPPLVLEELVEITEENSKAVAENKIKRQITKNFYNNIVYRFDLDEITDKFRAGQVVLSQRSVNRIDTGNKTLKIESSGLRDSPATRTFIKAQARRFSDRYQFAAESISVQTNYRTGFNIEISDVVLFGNSALQIPDIKTGTRDFEPRLMEVVNKSMNIKSGQIKLELLDTGFGIDGRFAVVSPNSFVGSGATVSNIPLKKSFRTTEFQAERDKWENFLLQEIRIRNIDYTFDETVRLIQFDPNNSTNIIIDPPLSSPPAEDYIVDLPNYDTVANEDQDRMKSIHSFMNTVITVVSGTSGTEFVVSLGDSAAFFVGAFIRVHNAGFTDNSTPGAGDDDAQVSSVDTGTGVVIVDKDLGFTPATGDVVDLIGFAIDEGLPYRFL